MDQTFHPPPNDGRQPGDASPPNLFANAIAILAGVFASAIALYCVLQPHLALGTGALAFAGVLTLVIFALVVRGLPHHRHKVFGAANAVTAIRTAIVSLVAATVFFAIDMHAPASVLWLLIALVLLALILDGFDGYLARALAQESDLGARFDMEVDALLILVLSAAALFLDKAGAWVLAVGLMRYGFIAAQYALPALGAPLPPSTRRKVICVVQVAALCVILIPVVQPPVSSLIAAAALALLVYSFAVDTKFLLSKGASRPWN
ncbi:CDP-alcohol phosphatidyltransferase family protein [Rhizobium sp. PAMB 3182]